MKPIRISEFVQDGYVQVSVYGMNIFRVNSVTVLIDPLLRFMSDIASASRCSMHLGTLAFEGDTPIELFGRSNSYQFSAVGIYGGTFYKCNNDENGLLLPESSKALRSPNADFMYYLRADAIALYVNPHRAADATNMELTELEFVNQRQWIREILTRYEFIVTTLNDGWHVHVYFKAESDPAWLKHVLVGAKNLIVRSPWYKEHSSELRWDGKVCRCLTLESARARHCL